MIVNELLNKIKQAVNEEDVRASVILFGSRARGNFQVDSDWDILVLCSVKKENLSEFERTIRKKIWEIEKTTGEAINLVFHLKTEWIIKLGASLFFKKINEEGRVL